MPDRNLILMAAAAAVVVLLLAFFLVSRRRKHRVLVDRYGSQYEALSEQYGGKVDKELKLREKRFEKAHIHDLTPADRDRYSSLWQSVQARFVDSPAAAVAEADTLIAEVMRLRGYPAADPAQRMADVAVGHPDLVGHYRDACAVATSSRMGKASTEDLRQAMVHYRTLFEDLLGVPERELVGAH